MLSGAIEEALGGPLSLEGLEEVCRQLWRALGEGHLSAAEAERLDGLARARRAEIAGRAAARGGAGGAVRAGAALGAGLRRPKRPRSPEHAASLARRRRVASSGAVPPRVAEHLTPGQIATLSVVGRAVVASAGRGRPWCDWCLDRIAALAGVGRTTAREALRAGQRLGLVRVRFRPRRGARSDTNVVTVTEARWWGWLRRRAGRADEALEGCSEGGGSGKAEATATQGLREGKKGGERRGEEADGPSTGSGEDGDGASRTTGSGPGARTARGMAPRGG